VSRFGVLTIAWLAALVAGFAIVLVRGRPLPTQAEALDSAYHPATPVSREAAVGSAAAIVRLQYPEFDGLEPGLDRRSDAGIDRWVVTYQRSRNDVVSGLKVSITVERGVVEVVTFP